MISTNGERDPQELELGDFLTAGQFAEALHDARWRVIRVFADARSGKGRRATHGYIVGLDDKLTSLATYIQRVMSERAQNKIYSLSDLPVAYRDVPKRHREAVARQVRFEIFMRLLVMLRDMKLVWYVNGEWWVPQSVADEYLTMFKGARQSYRNDRHFHGRPARDRVRMRGLRQAPGLSIAS